MRQSDGKLQKHAINLVNMLISLLNKQQKSNLK